MINGSKEYKGIYFSNKSIKNNNNNKPNIKKHKKTFFENGAHFKYSLLYKELQKLFKIQNYSLPKKKIKRKKESLNTENINKYNKIFIYKIDQIKNKNRHNINHKSLEKNGVHSIENTTFNKNNRSINKCVKSQNIIINKNKNNHVYSSFNSQNKLINNTTCDNTIKKKKNKNESKIFHVISAIRKKSVENKNKKNCSTLNNQKYSSSFIKNINPSTPCKKQKKLAFNLKSINKNNNNLIVSNPNKDIIKVKTKILNLLNKNNK